VKAGVEMSKKMVAFLAALPALMILSAFRIVPTIQAILISFKYYIFSEGVFASKSADLPTILRYFRMSCFLVY
jgi:ABC-type sugar transport system permease subunit